MTIRAILGRSQAVRGLACDLRRLREFPRRAKAGAQIRDYLRRHAVRKLQVGCGFNCLDGWLNTDLSPARKEVVFLDASRPFPIESGTFDFVYSEHTIEHLTQLQGRLMLSECFRVLRPGGAIRMATPDLRRIITLLEPAPSEFVRTYLEWSTQMFLPWAPGPSGVCVVNNFFRDWGHQFIYDEDTLRYQLGQAGFVEIHACEYSKSETPEFRRVESHAAATSNEAMMMFETMVLEARKPGAGPSGSRCAVTAHQHEGRPE